MQKYIFLFFFISFAKSFALTEAAKTLSQFETKGNAISLRSDKPVSMPHLEIPLNEVSVDFAQRLSDELRKELIIRKNDKYFVRWILNPEDTKWTQEIIAHFEKKGLKLAIQHYFIGYQTASRSYLVEDPSKKIQFSVKSSTNKTGGGWADKKQTVGEAHDGRMNADLLDNLQKVKGFENFMVMDEPGAFKIAAIDEAMVIRDLSILDRKKGYSYIPGFSALHQEVGAKIASLNGSKDPYLYWTEHYIQPVARALAEFAARTGMQFDSPHSQNFLIELDEKRKPTGKIVIRDLTDLYINKLVLKEISPIADKHIAEYSQKKNLINYFAVGFGPLHGNKSPNWVTTARYDKWKDVFFKEFEKTFSKYTHLPLESFKLLEGERRIGYFKNQYIIDNIDSMKAYWKQLPSVKTGVGGKMCSAVFL